MGKQGEHIKKCVVCNSSFVAKRSDAKTCSDACRSKLARDKRIAAIKTLTGRNVYFGVAHGKYVKIKAPEGVDIAKELNLRRGTERVIKEIEGNKRYIIEYYPIQ